MTDTAARPITLDFATDHTLAASLAALDPHDRTRLTTLLSEAANRDLIAQIRTATQAAFPTRSAIGVVFQPASANSDGYYLSADGVILFNGGTVDYHLYDDEHGDIEADLRERWPVVDANFAVIIDLRGEGSVTTEHGKAARRSIHASFGLPEPA